MSLRLQVTLDASEQESVRREAERLGMSVSARMREAAGERLRARAETAGIETTEPLESFFAACDEREEGVEPDWEEQLTVIDSSRRSGSTET